MNQSELDPKRGWQNPTDWYWLAVLLCIASLAWCAAYNRWTAEAWKTPIVYQGDALLHMAATKTFASGEAHPILLKFPTSLGAPLGANWNDFPITEEGIFLWCGLLVRLFGVFIGSNLAVLSAHFLAAGSFYFVCRVLGYARMWSLAGAFLFSMSHFAFARSLPHLVLGFYWHVPLGLLVVWWCGRSAPLLNDRKKILLCVAVAVLHGIQNPYYTGIFLQFLVLASVICLIRREPWPRVMFPLFVVSVLAATFLLMNADTLYYRFAYGPNLQAVIRNYAGLERFALKPIELFLPSPHRIISLQSWADKMYFSQSQLLGETGSPYLGIIGIVALCVLAYSTVLAVVDRRSGDVPWQIGLVLWVFLYSVIGGANGFLGLFGLVFFRGTNRYSIVILALVLLFLVRHLTWLTRRWHPIAVSALAGAASIIGFLDQSPPPPTQRDIAKVRSEVLADSKFVSILETKLPARAMVFELPIVGFPETPAVREMQAYEHLRPYLYSRSLRFSYGSVKGRPRERWQREAEQLGPTRLVNLLETYGFSAILINKKAYEGQAGSLLSDFRAAGRAKVLVESTDLVSVALFPHRHPIMPPVFDEHWYNLEGDDNENWRWSSGNAHLILSNPRPIRKLVRLAFRLGSLESRQVNIYRGLQKVYAASLDPSAPPPEVDLSIWLLPGVNDLHFLSDRPAQIPGSEDARKLAFRVIDFKIVD